MPGKRIKDLTALSGAGSANDDDVVIFDTTANETKRISRSQLAEGMQADVQVLTNKTIALGSNTVTGTTAQFNTALTDNNFATQAGAEALTNKTIVLANNTVNYTQGDTGAAVITVQDKLRQTVSASDFTGYDPTGTTDSAGAINAALAAAADVLIIGTPLIASTITIPPHKKLRFSGGPGNSSGSYPASYIIKKATMTTVGISISETGAIDGGGLVCQSGNTGGGIALVGNSAKVRNFLVHGAGGVGVRVGVDSEGGNCNSFILDNVVSQYNTSHGFYIHDGTALTGANANAGTLVQCFSQHNGGDGFRLGHAFWVTLLNCLSEVNTGWGLYLSGTDNNTYPECRWVTMIGGDYNEGNTAGIVFDQSYFSTFINPDPNSIPTTVSNGLQGSAARNIISGGYGQSRLQGLVVDSSPLVLGVGQISFPVSQVPSPNPNTLDDYEEGTWTPVQAGVTLASSSGTYTKIGRLVHFTFDITWPVTADATGISITGFVHTSISNGGTLTCGYTTYTSLVTGQTGPGGLACYNAGGVPNVQLTNANLSGSRIIASGSYITLT